MIGGMVAAVLLVQEENKKGRINSKVKQASMLCVCVCGCVCEKVGQYRM